MATENYVTFDPRIPKHTPVITKILILLICILFIVEILFNAFYGEKAIIILGAKWNEGITHGEYWRFLTCTFLHGNLFHLLLNLTALYIFGLELESIFGTIRFLLVYLISSWGASLSSYAFSSGVAIGASGAVFGIIGGIIIFFYRQKEKLSGANLRFKSMYTLVAINLLLGFIMPRIDNSAHIGGLLTGLSLAWFIAPEYKIEKSEELDKLVVIQKINTSQSISGLILIITILFWLTKTAIDLHVHTGT